MRSIYCLLLFISLSASSYAQQHVSYAYDAAGNRQMFTAFLPHHHVSYAYDAAGNRISRTIALRSRAARSEMQQKDSAFVQDVVTGASLRIYPNPVQSILTVSVAGEQSQQPITFSLLDAKGALLQSGRLREYATQINMRHLSPGIYILMIRRNEQLTTWKVIKQ